MNPTLLDHDLSIGRSFAGAMTVTETHIVVGGGLIGGFQAAHVDQQYAKARGLKGTILHGSLTAAIMSAVVGRHLPCAGWTVLEQSTRYRGVVYAGGTLNTTWTVDKHTDKPALLGWIVELDGKCLNQDLALVAQGRLSLLVRR